MSNQTFPSLTRAPSSVEITVISNTARFVSPLNGAVRTLARPGTRLRMTLTWTDLDEDDRLDLEGFLARIQADGSMRIAARDYTATLRGEGGGTPVISGGSQSGTTLSITGATPSQVNWLRRGDRISFFTGTGSPQQHVMKIVTADVTTNGAGEATVPIAPELHFSPTNGVSVVTDPDQIYGTWLIEDPESSWSVKPPLFSDFTITLIEDIT